jgi:hypothetical protein
MRFKVIPTPPERRARIYIRTTEDRDRVKDVAPVEIQEKRKWVTETTPTAISVRISVIQNKKTTHLSSFPYLSFFPLPLSNLNLL